MLEPSIVKIQQLVDSLLRIKGVEHYHISLTKVAEMMLMQRF
jgi:hypothetical protein